MFAILAKNIRHSLEEQIFISVQIQKIAFRFCLILKKVVTPVIIKNWFLCLVLVRSLVYSCFRKLTYNIYRNLVIEM